MPGLWNKLFGNRGERAAARFLRRQGLRIVERNYSTPLGEIDIVALDGTTIVFVEVKTRSSLVAGRPEEAVTPDKQKKLTKMALVYLKKHKLLEHSARFDVVAIVWSDGAREPDEIRHLRNAFEPTGKWQMFS
ncbi:MAG: YraN family protein [Planctomycetes bacterium]|nr:YraN family protein [Planctomycetota bacterium]